MNKWFCFLLPLLAILACKGEKQEVSETAQLEAEVMEVHDAVMPKLGLIESLHTELLDALKSDPLDSMQREAVSHAITGLHASDSLMWDWMHNYALPKDGDEDQVRTYLLHEKVKIDAVRDTMLSAIDNAEHILQKLGHGKMQ